MADVLSTGQVQVAAGRCIGRHDHPVATRCRGGIAGGAGHAGMGLQAGDDQGVDARLLQRGVDHCRRATREHADVVLLHHGLAGPRLHVAMEGGIGTALREQRRTCWQHMLHVDDADAIGIGEVDQAAGLAQRGHAIGDDHAATGKARRGLCIEVLVLEIDHQHGGLGRIQRSGDRGASHVADGGMGRLGGDDRGGGGHADQAGQAKGGEVHRTTPVRWKVGTGCGADGARTSSEAAHDLCR
ncbi:hypothetical protein G6F60_013748 [Rhizopus arrhizus]|nr:hypothetical protein G6F60_013748 [Rhizopus arrhizus]